MRLYRFLAGMALTSVLCVQPFSTLAEVHGEEVIIEGKRISEVDTYTIPVGSSIDLLSIAKSEMDKYDCPCPRYLATESKCVIENAGWITGKKKGVAVVDTYVGKNLAAKYRIVVKNKASAKDLAKLKKLGKKYINKKRAENKSTMVVEYVKGVVDLTSLGAKYQVFRDSDVLTVILPVTQKTKKVKVGDKCVLAGNKDFLSGLAIRVSDISTSEKGVVLTGGIVTELSEIFSKFEFSNMER